MSSWEGLSVGAAIFAVAAGIALALGLSCLGAGVVWFVYNIVLVPCFPALPKIGFWAIWAILFLIRVVSLIFRGK